MAPAASSIFCTTLLMTPTLHTPRLTFRPIAVADAPAPFAYRRSSDVMRYWDWPQQQNLKDVQRIIRAHAKAIGNGTVEWWAVALTDDSRALGECDLSAIDHHHKHAEVGFL